MIRDTLIPKMEPVYGLTTMHASLRAFSAVRVGDSSNGVRYSTFAFGLIALGKFVLRLPPEVAEEELPRLKETLTAVGALSKGMIDTLTERTIHCSH